MTAPLYALIVAGGSGTRMQSQVPKQFIPIGDKPVLMHTLDRFHSFSSAIQLILVLPHTQLAVWKQLCATYHFQVPHTLVTGGNTRFESVQNGLQAISGTEGVVAIHDGVRPFVPVQTIAESFEVASVQGTGVVAVASKDSVRILSQTGNQAIDRQTVRLVQTPQTFQVQLIKQAFAQATHTDFSDDASVAEAAGYLIHLVEGSYRNIKITTPEDLIIAEVLLRSQT